MNHRKGKDGLKRGPRGHDRTKLESSLDPSDETTTGNDSVYKLQYPVHGKNTGFLCPSELNLQAEHMCFAAMPFTYCA